MRLIGDVHGKFRRYREIIRDCSASIQVGDMGVGFRSFPHGEPQANPPFDAMFQGDHRFIRGNHDNPAVCRKHLRWIHDGAVEGTTMFIGGGDSIDKAYRIKDYSWWEDEQLSYKEFNVTVGFYTDLKPLVMITHECPSSVAVELCRAKGVTKWKENSITSQALEMMFSIHRPKLWVFGHWHNSFDAMVYGTRFICLNELEYREVNLETGEADERVQTTKGNN
jgi:Calcineurin-like phosphoesterase